MKRINLFLACVHEQIKKNFFKVEKTDINQACIQLKNMEDAMSMTDEERKREDYARIYNVTTRWQTV
ncbi:hypothetical protein [uncultured Draconibacterium sp.]|uniref:hypothetical protein n=1 Tax=uncultured Draconibacterium sp. TaxID=1573823 RepID=UPI0032616E96